ncbi:MAG: thioredoxin fold domain-containing protein [Hyphomicrobiales bacterium]|nr:thioredoxin fold domain-containing protein [Hyphomicrobiales bacterium]MCP5000800.1 thioredoxin fold domain-containing protein [Hyphomicrobiales bacterium]
MGRLIVIATFAVMAILTAPVSAFRGELLPETPVGDDGMHKPEWFLQSFLDLGEDHAEAADEGKGLVVIFEQKGCPYCRELHRVNLRDPEIVGYIQDRFNVLQFDLNGSREVTDFDGEAMEERALARRWSVIFTPTVMFLPHDAAATDGKTGLQLSAMTVPGYFKPFHFASLFEYVADGHHKSEHFQKFLNARADRMRAEGKDVSIWD